MPIRIPELKSLTGGLMVAALLGAPLAGCGDDDDDDSTAVTTPTPGDATPTATATEPPPPTDRFPYGQYYYTFAYVLSFNSLPYSMTMIGYTWDANNVPTGKASSAIEGNWEGQNVLAVWNTRSSYQQGNQFDCLVYEALTATDHASGTDGDVDYSTCEFCEPFADTFTDADGNDDDSPDNAVGCEQDFIDAWYYYDDVGEYDYTFAQYQGYRDAGSDGWPGAFADLVPQLEENGYVGTLYDQFTDLVTEGEVNFAPGYFVKPTDLNAKIVPGAVDIDRKNLTEVTLPSFEAFRAAYKASHK